MTNIFRNASGNKGLTAEDKNKIKELNYENQEKLVDLFKKYPPIKANSKELNKAVDKAIKMFSEINMKKVDTIQNFILIQLRT
ncbi:hypothetical protein [Leptotrichia alba]|uniref:Uncharacterized protein n=1 Tax=Leptotrichia alba TaxID=3239304 RepID=A0AB39V7I5_9FUSO